jgi:hypothetical protein
VQKLQNSPFYFSNTFSWNFPHAVLRLPTCIVKIVLRWLTVCPKLFYC